MQKKREKENKILYYFSRSSCGDKSFLYFWFHVITDYI